MYASLRITSHVSIDYIITSIFTRQARIRLLLFLIPLKAGLVNL